MIRSEVNRCDLSDLLDPYLTRWEKRQSDDPERQLAFPH